MGAIRLPPGSCPATMPNLSLRKGDGFGHAKELLGQSPFPERSSLMV